MPGSPPHLPAGRYVRVLLTVTLAQIAVCIALRMMSPATLRSRSLRLRSCAQLLAGRASTQEVVDAIERTGRRLPAISTCLVRAFVADLLLGSPARPLRLTIGVKQTPTGLLESHAWVTDHQSVVIGAPCDGFVPIVEWTTP
jgi:transglutaminase superfamily protein